MSGSVHMRRVLMLVALLALLTAFMAPATALASHVKVSRIGVGDVKVKVKADRFLNDNEVTIIRDVVIGDIEVLNVCKSTRNSDLKECVTIIAKDVVNVTDSFNNFTLAKVCVSILNGDGDVIKSCRN